jgi:hypothetical protein
MLFADVMPLFAQARGGGGGNGGDAAAAIGVVVCYAILIIAILGMHILFALNLSRTLQQCRPRNRTIEPGQVWLNFIPFFNIVWIFITVIRVAETLEAEYRDRRIRGDGDFGKMNGLIAAVSAVIGCSPVALIFYIIYWVKMSGYRKELENRGAEREDYDEDDRPRRRSKRRDDEDDRDEDDDRPRRRNRDED